MGKPHKHAELIRAWADGAEIEYYFVSSGEWYGCVENKPAWDEMMEYRIKPEPPKYPQTRMTDQELSFAWHAIGPFQSARLHMHAIANAAIARAIEDGQVYVPGQPSSANPLGMVPGFLLEKVAEAVKAECVKLHNEQATLASAIKNAGTPYGPIVSKANFWQINIAAIIASVKEGK